MVLNELERLYQDIFGAMDILESYVKHFKNHKKSLDTNSQTILDKIYRNGIQNNAINNEINNTRGKILNDTGQLIKNIDIIDLQMDLLMFKQDIEDVIDDSEIHLQQLKSRVMTYIDEFEELNRIFQQYLKNPVDGIKLEINQQMDKILTINDSLILEFNIISKYIKDSENKFEESEDEQVMELQLYNSSEKFADFTSGINDIKEMYEVFGEKLGISTSVHSLKIVKIESGSLFAKICGDKSVIGCISYFLKKITDLMFNKFTYEGKIYRAKQLLELLEDDLEYIEKCKELGLDTNFAEVENQKAHLMLVKSVQKIAAKNTKIRIDDETKSIDKQLEQKFLDSTQTLKLEEETS